MPVMRGMSRGGSSAAANVFKRLFSLSNAFADRSCRSLSAVFNGAPGGFCAVFNGFPGCFEFRVEFIQKAIYLLLGALVTLRVEFIQKVICLLEGALVTLGKAKRKR